MKLVLKYFRDERLSAFSLSLASQYFRTAALTMDLALSLDGGSVSHSDGWGRPYWRKSCLSLQNQDLGQGEEEENTFLAWCARMLSPSLSLHT